MQYCFDTDTWTNNLSIMTFLAFSSAGLFSQSSLDDDDDDADDDEDGDDDDDENNANDTNKNDNDIII